MQGILIEFVLFLLVQSLAINGWHECFKGSCWNDLKDGWKCSGNIFYKISPKFFEKHKGKWWTMFLWGCIKCESSVIGSITYWITVLSVYGFYKIELLGWLFDMFALVTLNWLIYKKL